MFDGVGHETRKVSLSGKLKEKSDSKALLLKAKQQREDRALERKRYTCAVSIQKIFRGFILRKKQNSFWRSEFDSKVSDIEKIVTVFKSAHKEFVAPWSSITPLFTRLVIFYKMDDANDEARLKKSLCLYQCANCPTYWKATLCRNNSFAWSNEAQDSYISIKLMTLAINLCSNGVSMGKLDSDLLGLISRVFDANVCTCPSNDESLVCGHYIYRIFPAVYGLYISLLRSYISGNGEYAAELKNILILSRVLGVIMKGNTSKYNEYFVKLMSLPNLYLLSESVGEDKQLFYEIFSSDRTLISLYLHLECLVDLCLSNILTIQSTGSSEGTASFIFDCMQFWMNIVLSGNISLNDMSCSEPDVGFTIGSVHVTVHTQKIVQILGFEGIGTKLWMLLYSICNLCASVELPQPWMCLFKPSNNLSFNDAADRLTKAMRTSSLVKKLSVFVDIQRILFVKQSMDLWDSTALSTIFSLLCTNSRFFDEVYLSLNNILSSQNNSVRSASIIMFYSEVIKGLLSRNLDGIAFGLSCDINSNLLDHFAFSKPSGYLSVLTLKLLRSNKVNDLVAFSEKMNDGFTYILKDLQKSLVSLMLSVLSLQWSVTDDSLFVVEAEHTFINSVFEEKDLLSLTDSLKSSLFEALFSSNVLTEEQKLMVLLSEEENPNNGYREVTFVLEAIFSSKLSNLLLSNDSSVSDTRKLPVFGVFNTMLLYLDVFNLLYERVTRLGSKFPSFYENPQVFLWDVSYRLGNAKQILLDEVMRHPVCVDGSLNFVAQADYQSNDGIIRELSAYGSIVDSILPGKFDDGFDDNDVMKKLNKLNISLKIARLIKSLVNTIPQVFPFERRVVVFRALVRIDQRSAGLTLHDLFGYSRRNITVRRTNILEDTYMAVTESKVDVLKGPFQVNFVSEHGIMENGIDGGGLFKEYLDKVLKSAFGVNKPPSETSPDFFNYFMGNSDHFLLLNPESNEKINVGDVTILQYYHLIGKLLGKAIYENVLVESQLSVCVLNSLLGKMNTFDDLIYYDKELYRSLCQLKKLLLAPNADEQIESLELYFDTTVKLGTGEVVTREIMEGGSSIHVVASNLLQYVNRLARFKLELECKTVMSYFLAGFHELVKAEWTRMFSALELQRLIGGDSGKIDVYDLQMHCNYGGGYHPSQPYIQAFWEIVCEMTAEDQGKLLKFVTSCQRQPLLGFAQLNPRFGIQKIDIHDSGTPTDNVARLPSAATCMNLLKLPQYESVDMLKEKLLYAIRSDSGFDLS